MRLRSHIETVLWERIYVDRCEEGLHPCSEVGHNDAIKPWDTVAQAKTYIEKYEFPWYPQARLTVQHAMVHKNNLAGSSDKKL